jgi:DNA-directed RNA polymerase alpha subunit
MGPIPRRRRHRSDAASIGKCLGLSAQEIQQLEIDKRLDVPLGSTPLELRIVNSLAVHDIHTLRALVTLSRDELMALRNLGDRTFIKIVRAVNALGIFPKSWSARSSRAARQRRAR